LFRTFENLVEQFKFEARFSNASEFAVLATFIDESGNYPSSPGRIAVAGAMATAENWEQFQDQWRANLEVASALPAFRGFHAKNTSRIQSALNETLAHVCNDRNIWIASVTVNEKEYKAATTHEERSLLGNAYGFAAFACVGLIAQQFRVAARNSERAIYYIEKGGPGFAKTMELLAIAYRNDTFRKTLCLESFAPADRRIHTPVHPADLVAHEIVTNPKNSVPLAILGQRNRNEDITADRLRGFIADYKQLMRKASQLRAEHKRRRKKR
jgi:hypothetical protein